MLAYIEFTKMSPQELINEAKAEAKAGLDMSDRKIRDYLNDFRSKLRAKDLADTTVRARMAAVKSFYTSLGVDLPRVKREKHRAKMREEHKAIPTKEDLQAVLDVADRLEKAILLVGVSSGLSINEICNLKIRNFRKGYDPETGITTLDLRRGKTDVDFVTFLSPEASRAVIDYLDFRGRKSKITTPRRQAQLEKQRIVSDTGYLFILRNVPDEYLTTKKESLRQLTPLAISKIYRALSEKTLKNSEKGSYNVIRSHNMRKYFNSALLGAGADSFHVEFWMGHAIDNTRAAYFRARLDDERAIYAQYVPYLTLQKDLDVSKSPEYKKAVADNKGLTAALATAVVENRELQDLRVEMAARKEFENMFEKEVRAMKAEMDRFNAIKDIDDMEILTAQDFLLKYKYDNEFREKHFKKGAVVKSEEDSKREKWTSEDWEAAHDYGEGRE